MPQFRNLNSYLQEVENQNQSSRMRKITDQRQIKNRKIVKKIKENKNCFLEKINEIDKLVRFTKIKREKNQITKIRVKLGHNYQFYRNKKKKDRTLSNYLSMNQVTWMKWTFLESQNLPRINHKYIEYLDVHISSKENESKNKILKDILVASTLWQ